MLDRETPSGPGNNNGRSENTCSATDNSSQRNAWNRVQVHEINANILNGWWNLAGTVLRTLIAVSAPPAPALVQSKQISGLRQLEAF